jgi:hypothetical protein
MPPDYHCRCDYCTKIIGELRPIDGSYYSRLERREYYAKAETRKEDGSGHIAKTPLHIARWAIQAYTEDNDWVLDPTIGAGTTAVEALTHGCNVAGMELEYGSVLQENVELALTYTQAQGCEAKIAQGDARNIGAFLRGAGMPTTYKLVVNNPPYSGDVSAYPKRDSEGKVTENASYLYDPDLPNLAFLKEGDEYWETLGTIYDACIERLAIGGHFVIGVKDMMRNKEPYLLHKELCDLIAGNDEMEFVGTAFLKHHPGTWFLNSYEKTHGVKPPLYQTISVFKKVIAPSA